MHWLIVAHLTIIALAFPAGSAYAIWGKTGGGSVTHDNFPPYEIGDIVVFGPAGTDSEHTGHSALLGPRKSVAGQWLVTLIDAMPASGVTENNVVNHDGFVEKILTHSSLAEGAWSQAKQDKRQDILARGTAIKDSGALYIVYDPPITSDVSYMWFRPIVTESNAIYDIQPDSIHADPPGTHDYFPRQKGHDGANRFTCSGFTERVYEDSGLNLVANAAEHEPNSPYYEHKWYEIGLDIPLATADIFWPIKQTNAAATSNPKGPEVQLSNPIKNSAINADHATIVGTAQDVSGLREDKIQIKHTKPDNTTAVLDVPVNPASNTFSYSLTGLAEGLHKLEVVAYDQAGNKSEEFTDGTLVNSNIAGGRFLVENEKLIFFKPAIAKARNAGFRDIHYCKTHAQSITVSGLLAGVPA